MSKRSGKHRRKSKAGRQFERDLFDKNEQAQHDADLDAKRITPTDTGLDAEDEPRVESQSGRVLARLRKGPATNEELEDVCGRVNSRIADVRRWLKEHEGKTIVSTKVGGATYRYEIVDEL